VWPCSMCALEKDHGGCEVSLWEFVSYSNILSLTMGFYTNTIFYWSINCVMTRSRHIGTNISSLQRRCGAARARLCESEV
jgi:hypothetical protein